MLDEPIRGAVPDRSVPFVDRGLHALRGVEGDHHLFAVAEPDDR